MSELSRRARWLLLISLLLNAVLIGGLIGHRLAARKAAPERPTAAAEAAPPRSVGRLARMLPAEQRPLVRAIFENHRPHIHAQADAIRDARRRLAALLRADPLDRPALDAALADLREAEQTAAQSTHAMMLDLFERLPPEQRQRLAERLEPRERRERRR